MPKANLGTKRICPNCHQPFYDLQKNPAHCPNCEHDFDPTEVLRGRRSRGNELAKDDMKGSKAVPPDAVDVPDGDDADDADEDLLEDASDLGEDEDDMSEVIENVDESGEER